MSSLRPMAFSSSWKSRLRFDTLVERASKMSREIASMSRPARSRMSARRSTIASSRPIRMVSPLVQPVATFSARSGKVLKAFGS